MGKQTDLENIQSVFLKQVRERLPQSISFVDELAELLDISRDSAYRRIRGETVLSLDEVKKLYDRFGISIDVLMSQSSQMVTFHRRVLDHTTYTVDKWLNSLLKNLNTLRRFEDHEIIFSAKDIPVFHYFRMPQLASFKLFFWMKTLIGYPEYESAQFSFTSVSKDLIALAERVWAKYSSLHTVEIWNEEAVYDTLKQIEFYLECGFFRNKEDALTLCDHLILLLGEIKDEAAAGKKSEGGNFGMFNNEILIADNTVFARMGSKRSVYVNQNTLNLLLTFQEPFCGQTEHYLQNLMKKSNQISITGERERNRFFKNMNDRIIVFKERVK
jgi:transcriptional regulator with XRE-family HTH domain